MASLTSRITVLLSPKERERLETIARQNHTSLGALIREALRKIYLKDSEDARKEAADYLCSLELAVEDWEKMEKEIINSYLKE